MVGDEDAGGFLLLDLLLEALAVAHARSCARAMGVGKSGAPTNSFRACSLVPCCMHAGSSLACTSARPFSRARSAPHAPSGPVEARYTGQ